jgi:hypothetical protein
MITQELLDYIQKKLEKGSSKEEIKGILLGHGWQEKIVEEAFDTISKKSVSPEKNPKEELPSEPKITTEVPLIEEPFLKPTNQEITIETMPTETPLKKSFSEPIKEFKKPLKRKCFVFIILILLISSIAYAYYYAKEPLFVTSKMLDKTLEIKSFEIENDLKVTIDDSVINNYYQNNNIILEKEYDIKSYISFDFINDIKGKADVSLFENNIDLGINLINNNLYGKINKIDYNFEKYDFTLDEEAKQNLINKWVSLGQLIISSEEIENNKKQIIELIKTHPKLINKIQRLSQEKNDYHYKLEINKDELNNIIKEYTNEEQVFSSLEINNFEIWIDKKEKHLSKIYLDLEVEKIHFQYNAIITNHNTSLNISETQEFLDADSFLNLIFLAYKPTTNAIIKEYMQQIKFIADTYKTNNNQYSNKYIDNTACNKYLAKTFLELSTGGYALCEELQNISINPLIIRINNLKGDEAKYCIQKSLDNGNSWCIDSTGFMGYAEGCDNLNFDCKN